VQDDGKYASRLRAKLSGGFCVVLPTVNSLENIKKEARKNV